VEEEENRKNDLQDPQVYGHRPPTNRLDIPLIFAPIGIRGAAVNSRA
jgi:hypothetical protein